MCGICGIFNYANSNFEINKKLIIKMRDTMIHRGPDDAGVYISPDRIIGLGHRRLSILDLSAAGRQPMSDDSGKVWIVYNGEVYNFLELRQELYVSRLYLGSCPSFLLISQGYTTPVLHYFYRIA